MTGFNSKRMMARDNEAGEHKMNDKLEELMYHAGLTAQGCWDEMDDYDHEAIEKFAELIVRECAKIADIADENKCEWIGGNILTHFGVEE